MAGFLTHATRWLTRRGPAPTVSSTQIPTADVTTLEINFTIPGKSPILPEVFNRPQDCFLVLVDDVPNPVISASRTGSTRIVLQLTDFVFLSQVVTLTYTGGEISDSFPTKLLPFSNLVVQNNSLLEI